MMRIGHGGRGADQHPPRLRRHARGLRRVRRDSAQSTCLGIRALCATTSIVVFLLAACAAHHRPAFDTPHAVTLQKEIVSRLAGAADVRPGVRLSDRSTVESKKQARAYLAGLLERFGLTAQHQAYSAEGENIYAIVSAGRSSADMIVLGAHYDTVRNSPGANDNASGVAAVAAVAEHLSHLRARPEHDLAFVFFDEEERGLRGSRAFAQMLADEHRAIHSVHTIDQMGWDANGNRAIELERPYDGALTAYESAARLLGMDVVIHTTTEAGSDHSAFRRLGFKAVGVTEEYRHGDTTPHIHRPTDTVETVNFDYLASTTKLLTKVIETLAWSR